MTLTAAELIAEAREMGTEDRTEVAVMIDRLADALEDATTGDHRRAKGGTIAERAYDLAATTPLSYEQAHEAILHTTDLWDERVQMKATNAALVTLVQPILDRTEGQIGTHSDKCYEYHVACLAAVVRHRLGGTE